MIEWQRVRSLMASVLAAVLLAYAGNSAGTLLSLSDSPLFLGVSVDPNVFFELDDSGSMDWEILTRRHWHFCSYDPDPGATGGFDSSDCGWEITTGTWRTYSGSSYRYFEYLYDNSDNAYTTGCDSGRETRELCPASNMEKDWRVLSSSLNLLYYDPAVSYQAWPGLSNASFTSARSDPQPGTAGYSVTRDLTGFVYEVWQDDHGYSGDGPRRGTNSNSTGTANGEVDLWDKHTRYIVNAGSITVETVTYAPDSSGLHETVVTTTLNATDTDPYGRTLSETKQNIANWYQYARRRSFVAKSALANVVDDAPENRYGLSVINNGASLFIETPAAGVTDYSSHNSGLLESLFDYDWPAENTPLRLGLQTIGKYFDGVLSGKADPVIHSCQQNFAVLLTDGYWNGDAPSPSVNNPDGDGHSDTLADVAKHYYDTDLSTLDNEVPTNPFDSASHQHMVTFTVAFGVDGNLVDTNNDGWPDPSLIEGGNWGNPYNSDPEKIDDLWHAAYNSKGTYVAAQTPAELVSSLQDALDNIADRTGSAASVVLDSGTLASDTYAYQARFFSGDWSGELLAYPINSDGSLGSVAWNAAAKINDQDYDTEREIITYDPVNAQGIPFRWPTDYANLVNGELSSDQVGALLTNSPGAASNQAYGQALLDYLRGAAANEGTGYNFRVRTDRLGDIIHSDPVFSGPPGFPYLDDWGSGSPENGATQKYSGFRSANAGRKPLIFVGANDGMLHAIDASDGTTAGQEVLAYVPARVFANLTDLASPTYMHRYFVDGSMNAGDAFFDTTQQWKTVLVGGLKAGGQGIFALDVTNPAGFDESAASNIVLWEFTDQEDVDLGYTFSQVAIARMHNDQWVAILGNGYNNSEADGHTSSTGNAVLFILDLETGAVIKKIDTEAGMDDDPLGLARPNGLATPSPVDVDGDNVIDYVYAGDLYGNLWKFDLSASNTNQWDVAYKTGITPDPLYVAVAPDGVTPQPITVRPEVGLHPTLNGYMVYFGTGKYIETGDNSATGQATQTFYGVWDRNESSLTPFDRNDLLQQKITQELSSHGYEVRISTVNAISWHSTSGTTPSDTPPSTHLGWYLDLLNTENDNTDNKGEKVVSRPLLRSNKIVFTTLVPSDSPCDFGGSGWLMEIDAKDGSRLEFSPFDLNGDGLFSLLDYVNLGDVDGDGVDDWVPASGKKSKVGIAPTPGVVTTGDKEYKYASGSSGSIEVTTENPGPGAFGRRSWRELGF